MIQRGRHYRLCVILLVLNLCFIWGNSMLPGSVSGALSNWVKDVLASLLPANEEAETSGGLLRKLAHFLEFGSLGLLLSWRMALTGKKIRQTLFWGVPAACVDELIQCFVPDRGPGLRDVGIDTCGVAVGMTVFQIGYFLWKRKQSKQSGGK